MRRTLHVWLLLAVTAAGAMIGSPAGADGHQTAKGQSKPVYTQNVTEDYRVPTEHGTIYGIVQRPVVPAGVKVPVILTYSPYNLTSYPLGPNGTVFADGTAGYYVPRGYARAVFDLVGTKDSGGCYDYGGEKEGETGAAVVDFLGSQPWSNGKVGMIGGSYDGTTQYATALEAPEHLTTIVPQVAIDRWYDYSYEHGVRRYSGYGTPLLFDYGFATAPPLMIADDPVAWAEALAGHVNPCSRLEHQVRGYQHDPVYDDFWHERDYRAKAAQVEASVMIEGGWLDTNVQPIGSTRFFNALPDDHPKRLVIGQWGHRDANFSDSVNVRHAWFDHWLLGLDTGVMDLPRVDSGLRNGERIQDDHWPPLRTRTAPIALGAEPADEVAELGLELPNASWTDAGRVSETTLLRGNCRATSPSIGSGYVCTRLVSAPLAASIRISGTPSVDLTLTSEALGGLHDVATQVSVVLFEDNGVRVRATRGMLNILNRGGLDTSAPAASGEPYQVTVELDDVDWRVPEGARIGIALSADNDAVAFLPDDDPGATTTVDLSDGASVLHLPVSEGHTAVGLPEPEDEMTSTPTFGAPTAEDRAPSMCERVGPVLLCG